MRLFRSAKRRGAVVAAVLVMGATGVFTGLTAASASAQPGATGAANGVRCEYYHLSEKMTQWMTNMPPGEDEPAGFQASWLDELYQYGTTSGVVATAPGTMDVIRLSPEGHDIEFQFELFHFPHGTFSAESAFDRTLVITSQWISQPITGISGAYAGWKGVWTWRAEPVSDPNTAPLFEGKFTLCGR